MKKLLIILMFISVSANAKEPTIDEWAEARAAWKSCVPEEHWHGCRLHQEKNNPYRKKCESDCFKKAYANYKYTQKQCYCYDKFDRIWEIDSEP